MDYLTLFATTEAAEATEAAHESGLFDSIGINWEALLLQTIAFLVLLWLLKKFVYPPLVKMLDKRDEEIEASQKAAREVQAQADEANAKTEKLLKEARKEATELVEDAKKQSALIVSDAEKSATEKADAIAKKAEASLQQEVTAAKKALKSEMLDLVTLATEKVASKAVSSKVDQSLIDQTLKEAER